MVKRFVFLTLPAFQRLAGLNDWLLKHLKNENMKIVPIEEGRFYHIYNRGINSCDLFTETENYRYFLDLYGKYIDPIAHTYAWCLMRNHFHLFVYIKNEDEIQKSLLSYHTTDKPKQINASRQFSHLFNSYSLAFNKRNNRTGSLFEKPFERKRVDSMHYFRQLIYYIHNNPVHHGLTDKLQDYAWSSYGTVISQKPTRLKREDVICFFDSVSNFIDYHNQEHDNSLIEGLIID